MPPKRARVEEENQTNETMQDLQDLSETKKDLDRVTKTLFQFCNNKQGEEIEHLRREYKDRLERLTLTTALERTIPARDVPRGQSPMELLTPREPSQMTEVRVLTAAGRVTIAQGGTQVIP